MKLCINWKVIGGVFKQTQLLLLLTFHKIDALCLHWGLNSEKCIHCLKCNIWLFSCNHLISVNSIGLNKHNPIRPNFRVSLYPNNPLLEWLTPFMGWITLFDYTRYLCQWLSSKIWRRQIQLIYRIMGWLRHGSFFCKTWVKLEAFIFPQNQNFYNTTVVNTFF